MRPNARAQGRVNRTTGARSDHPAQGQLFLPARFPSRKPPARDVPLFGRGAGYWQPHRTCPDLASSGSSPRVSGPISPASRPSRKRSSRFNWTQPGFVGYTRVLVARKAEKEQKKRRRWRLNSLSHSCFMEAEVGIEPASTALQAVSEPYDSMGYN